MNYNIETEQRHYDSIYGQKRKDWPYDHLFRSAEKTFNDQVIELINQRDFTKILDLGCGNGEKTKYLQFIDKVKLIGIDISPVGIERANSEKEKNTKFYVMDAEKLSFNSNEFDLIINHGSFSSLNMSVVWPKLVHVLKPGGALIGIETLGSNPLFALKRKLNFWRKIRTNNVISQIVTFSWLRRKAKIFQTSSQIFFGLTSTIWAPYLSVLPMNSFLLRAINFTDKIDQYLLEIPLFQGLSYKTVFTFKSLIK